jgi:hypothetical protein
MNGGISMFYKNSENNPLQQIYNGYCLPKVSLCVDSGTRCITHFLIQKRTVSLKNIKAEINEIQKP